MTSWWFIIPTGILAAIGVGALIWRGGAWYGAVNTDRANFKEFMKEVREDLKKILQRLPEQTTASGSPVTLTDYGKTIAEDLGAQAWAEKLAPTLLPTVVGTRAFQVDEFARDHVTDDLSDDWRVRVAECAYEHGLKRDQVLAVLRVVLRDELLRIGNFSGPEDRPASP